jgi:hypothetical protein
MCSCHFSYFSALKDTPVSINFLYLKLCNSGVGLSFLIQKDYMDEKNVGNIGPIYNQ